MPRTHSKYIWPASAITESDMELLYRARELSPERTPISRLLAQAVRTTFGHLCDPSTDPNSPSLRKEVA